jgi:hypothetical protein
MLPQMAGYGHSGHDLGCQTRRWRTGWSKVHYFDVGLRVQLILSTFRRSRAMVPS